MCLYSLVFSSQLEDIVVCHQSEVQRNKMKSLVGKHLLKHRIILESLLFHHTCLCVKECAYQQSPEQRGLSRFRIKWQMPGGIRHLHSFRLHYQHCLKCVGFRRGLCWLLQRENCLIFQSSAPEVTEELRWDPMALCLFLMRGSRGPGTDALIFCLRWPVIGMARSCVRGGLGSVLWKDF